MDFFVQADGYEITIAEGASRSLAAYLAKKKDVTGIFVLTDTNTRSGCLPVLMSSVPELEDASILEVRPGENAKSLEAVALLALRMIELGADRNSLLISLGGGVVGDLGGFLASILFRGIRFVQLPTSLLAMVDASVGGKTGVNLDHLKNCIGTFSLPEAVFIDTDFLKTLPELQLRSGLAEIIKHSIVGNVPPFEDLPVAGDLRTVDWLPYIVSSVSFKNEIVGSDFRDTRQRKVLNFGHTIGHALEGISLAESERPLLHGEAIALGMEVELLLSTRFSGLPLATAKRMMTYIRSHFPELMPVPFSSRLLPYLLADKKNRNGSILCVLLGPEGNPVIDVPVSPDDIRQAMDSLSSVFITG
ncbi:MAG: hypothetical protein RL021_746 [Bacteroidota bacterium]|jgi:3-dehydroquinate synthase